MPRESPAEPASKSKSAAPAPDAAGKSVAGPAIELLGLWHIYGARGGALPDFEAPREEVLTALARSRDARSFALHVPRLVLRPGSFTCIVGSSGCGKTTLLSILGLLRASTFAARFALGCPDLSAEPLVLQRGFVRAPRAEVARLRRRRVGFALQAGAMIGSLSSAKNLELPLLAADARAERAELRARVRTDVRSLFPAQDEASCARLLGLYPSELSGGQAQRMLLARALVARPALIFADEPTNNLDPHSARAAVEALLGIREHLARTTVVMVTHDRALAARYGFDEVELATSPERPWFGTVVEKPATALATPVVAEPAPRATAPPMRAVERLPEIEEPRLGQRAGAYAALAIEEAVRAPAQLASLVLTLLCLALPLLTLLGLEAGALLELERRVKQSPHLARLIVWPPGGGHGVDQRFLDALAAKHPQILRVEPGLTRTVHLRLRRAGVAEAPPFFSPQLARAEASALAAKLGASARDRLLDEFELLWPNGAAALGTEPPIAELEQYTLAVALHVDQAQKLLDFARAWSPVAFPGEVGLGDPALYAEAAVQGRGGQAIHIPLRLVRVLDDELGRSPQIAYTSRRLLEALTWDLNGYPATLPNDSGVLAAPELKTIELFGFPARAEVPEPLYFGIWVHARGDAWLADPAVSGWLLERGLIATSRDDDPTVATLFGYFDLAAVNAAGGRVFSLVAGGTERPVPFGDETEEQLLKLAAAAGAEITVCPFEPAFEVRHGADKVYGIAVPFPRRDPSDARRGNDARLLELTSARIKEREEGGAPGRNGFYDHPAFQSEITPNAPDLRRDPFHALVTPKLERLLGAETRELEIAPYGTDFTTYPLRALHRRAIRLGDPSAEYVLVPAQLIGVDRARRAGRVELQRDPDHGPLFRRARDPQRDLIAPFANVYPSDVAAIPSIEAVLAEDFDVRAPGALRVRELARNAALLGAITRVVYWATFAAAIAAVFLVTALHERTKRRQTGVLALLGLPPLAVLWMVSARHAFSLVLAALAIALAGFLVKGAVALAVGENALVLGFAELFSVLLLVAASCALAFVWAAWRAARLDPVSLVDASA